MRWTVLDAQKTSGLTLPQENLHLGHAQAHQCNREPSIIQGGLASWLKHHEASGGPLSCQVSDTPACEQA